MENFHSLLLAFLEMLFIFIALLVFFQQRRSIGRAAFYLAFGFLQFFTYFVIAADVHGYLAEDLTFSVGELVCFMPLLAGFLLVYIARGTLVAQHLIVGMTALFGLYFYVSEITILQCSWSGYSFAGGLSAPALETLLRSGRVAMNETVLRQLLEIFTVSIVYSRLDGWRAPRWLCMIGALAVSQLIGLALMALTRIGVLPDLSLFTGDACVRLGAALLLGLLLSFYLAKLEQEALAPRSSPLDILFAFFGSYGRSKELESTLRDWTHRYQMLLENAAEAVLMVDDSGRISDANSVAAGLFGRGKSTMLLGMRLLDQMKITEPPDGDLSVPDGASLKISAVVHPGTKRERLLSGTLASLTIHDRRYRAVICRDVTEETKLAKEKAELADQLLHSQRLESLGILAGGVAHDFNNYIHAILGHVDVINLMHPPENAEQARHLDKIAAIAEQAGKLTSELLGFARKGRYKVEDLKVRVLLDDLMELIGPQKLQGVETYSDFPEGDYVISADRVQMQQVLLNITLNALDAMQDNPPSRSRQLRLAFGEEA
ncbi:MAG: PAS domain-containing protein, partial [Lentisphaeria bacterium]|nr:PAS domain-containing protein [Lentisphaeria bacterium]